MKKWEFMHKKELLKVGKRVLSAIMVLAMLCTMMCVTTVPVEAATGGVKAKLDTFMQSYPSGNTWTGSFDGGKQCYGFAKLVIYSIFGTNSSGGWLNSDKELIHLSTVS